MYVSLDTCPRVIIVVVFLPSQTVVFVAVVVAVVVVALVGLLRTLQG